MSYQTSRKTPEQLADLEITLRMEVMKSCGIPKNSEDRELQENAVKTLMKLFG